jgi:hypothetical protein
MLLGSSHSTIALAFGGPVNTPSEDTMKPRKITLSVKKEHSKLEWDGLSVEP